MIEFSNHLTIGTVIELVVIIVSFAVFIIRLEGKITQSGMQCQQRHAEIGSRLSILENRVTDLWKWWVSRAERRVASGYSNDPPEHRDQSDRDEGK